MLKSEALASKNLQFGFLLLNVNKFHIYAFGGDEIWQAQCGKKFFVLY
jgi:hypothetical protein